MCAGMGQEQVQQEQGVQLPPMGAQPKQPPQVGEAEKNAMIEQHMRLTDALSNIPDGSPERQGAMEQWLMLDGQLRQMIPQMPETPPPAYNPAAFDPSKPAHSI